ncbi:MAG: hypothetical protein ACLFV7_03760, partial [Phycisphaerae bacterium]
MRGYPMTGFGLALALAAAAAIGGPTASQPTSSEADATTETADTPFAEANPGYKKRAGEFYEKKYLGRALDQLAAAAELTDEQKTA